MSLRKVSLEHNFVSTSVKCFRQFICLKPVQIVQLMKHLDSIFTYSTGMWFQFFRRVCCCFCFLFFYPEHQAETSFLTAFLGYQEEFSSPLFWRKQPYHAIWLYAGGSLLVLCVTCFLSLQGAQSLAPSSWGSYQNLTFPKSLRLKLLHLLLPLGVRSSILYSGNLTLSLSLAMFLFFPMFYFQIFKKLKEQHDQCMYIRHLDSPLVRGRERE